MESRREKSSSGEIFSFLSTPVQDQDSDFEFGSITPDSPSTFNNSPADHLFVNGRLLPHSFPPQPIGVYAVDASRQTSRTSSVGSKDSFMSSRSNSTNSRSSSSCGSSTSARTSSSDNNNVEIRSSKFASYQKKSQKTSVSAQVYGSSQRWQFIASVSVPATLSRENSRRKKAVEKIGGKSDFRSKKRQTEKTSTARKKKKKKKKNMWFARKVFRWIILVCKECHAIEPSRKDEIVKKTKSTTTTKPKPKSY